MISKGVKNTQMLTKITRWKPQDGFYVDDSYTLGLEVCTFGTVITGEADGEVDAVISYAGHVGATYTDIAAGSIVLGAAKAFGVIYESSAIDQYRRLDDTSDETRLFPKGPRTDKKYALMPELVIEVADTEELLGSPAYFRTVDKLITEVATYGTGVVVLTGEVDLRIGEKFDVDGTIYWASDVVVAAGDTTITLIDAAGATHAETGVVTAISVLSQLFDIVYLADDMTGDLPFTTIPSTGRQDVGNIESAFAVRINTNRR